MGSHLKDGTQPGASDLVSTDTTMMEGVTATATTEEDQMETTAVEHTDDVWASTEGYSPLTDLQDGGAVFHAGPSYNNNDENNAENGNGGSSGRGEFFASHAGAFFADMAAFGPCDGDEDGEWGDDGVNDNNGYNNINDENDINDDNDTQEAETDFRQVAEKALMALEDDYLTTFQGSSRKPTTLELSAMPAAAVLASSEEDKRFAAMLFDMSKNQTETTDTAEVDADSKRKAAPTNDLVLPNIDTDAVRRAVQKIGLGNPKMQSNLSKWEESKKQTSAAIAPRTHPIIPATALKAFRMDTAKAVKATANLTRSACIAQALQRLDVLSKRSIGNSNSDTLIIHVIGCDHVECESVERIQHWFGFLARWMGAHADTHADSPRHLEIHLMGPNMPAQAAAWPAVDLLASKSTTESSSRLETARVMSHVGVYNEWIVDQKQADLVIAFNAGIWGYDDWRPTVEYLIRAKLSIPFVVTAYTLQEAQDDFDVIHDAVVAQTSVERAQECCQWQAEVNALASKVPRETATAIAGRHYRENGAWQAWCL
jgi:hypothetical protein